MTAQLVEIEGGIRDYAWGAPGGISRVLGRRETEQVEAELWLGAHPSEPSRATTDGGGWRDLAEWERSGAGSLPYLFKVLSADSPLSIQAHPTPRQAADGYARENSEGIPLGARERNYKDPHAKPELIVALEDGFEALCGFRPVEQTRDLARAFAEASDSPAVFAPWRRALAADDGVRSAFTWLLAGSPHVAPLIDAVSAVAASDPAAWEPTHSIARHHPGDPGVVAALMLNHVTLDEGDALWLPAGNIHAYLRGTGAELMGPSDNVLRGGLTRKHIDVGELARVLDFSEGEPPRLQPVAVGPHVRSYRPRSLPSGADVGFELLDVTGDADVRTGSAAIALVVDGAFRVSTPAADAAVDRGRALFVTDASTLTIRGAGRLFLATA